MLQVHYFVAHVSIYINEEFPSVRRKGRVQLNALPSTVFEIDMRVSEMRLEADSKVPCIPTQRPLLADPDSGVAASIA